MLELNLIGEKVKVKNVKQSQIHMILEWYNQSKQYKFATGIDRPVTIGEVWEIYREFLSNPDLFFACILRKNDDEIIGVVRGVIKNGTDKSIWIKSIIILNNYQKMGYGKESINLVINYLKKEKNISKVIISVATDNEKGLKFWYNMGFERCNDVKKTYELNKFVSEIVIMRKEI